MPAFLAKTLILITLLLPACTLYKKPPPLTSKKPPDASVLLQIAQNQSRAVESLEGRMSSKITSRRGKSASTQLILLKKPAFLRLDALTPFGQPALTVSTDGSMIFFYNHGERRYFTGMATSRHLSDILPPSLGMEELVLILGGGIPLIDHEKATVAADQSGRHYRLTLVKGKKREEIFFSPDPLEPARAVIYSADNKIILSLTMDDYKALKEVRLPATIKAVLPAEDYSLEIRYSEMMLNTLEETDFFSLHPPEGVAIENLDGRMF